MRFWRLAVDADRTGCRQCNDRCTLATDCRAAQPFLPENEAFYLGIDPELPLGEYKVEVPADVPVDAFWSISLYNTRGFFEPNERNAYSVNSVTGTRSDDGSITVRFGGCEDDRVNCLPNMEGWNYTCSDVSPEARSPR